MADTAYETLYGLVSNDTLRIRITVAIAEGVRIIQKGEDTVSPFDQNAPMPVQRRKWARRVIKEGPQNEASRFVPLILVTNKAFTPAQITGASDLAVQDNVNAIIDLIAEGEE